MILSVLDTQEPLHALELAPALERLGYSRYWLSEHYSSLQSASPVVFAALAAGVTERIRVGTGGVLLRAASVLRVAEDFAAVTRLFGGRIDLGVAGGLPPQRYVQEYSQEVRIADDDEYAVRVSRLVNTVRASRCGDIGAALVPFVEEPELWLCGTSVRSARLAGRLGMAYAYHHHLESAAGRANADAVNAYREEYRVTWQSQPRTAVVAFGACAATAEAANVDWSARFGDALACPSFVGDMRSVGDQLARIQSAYAADELLVDCFAGTFEKRLDGLARVAEAAAVFTVDVAPAAAAK